MFPYKKNNQIEFLIEQDAPFIWDESKINDYFLKSSNGNYNSDITPESKMFGDFQISDDNKKITFPIIHDISDALKGVQLMDFGKQVNFSIPIKKTNDDIGKYQYKPFISLGIETMAGYKVLKGREGGVKDNLTFFSEPKYKQNKNKVNLKIKLEYTNNEAFNDPIKIRWYRNPNLLLTLSKFEVPIEEFNKNYKSAFKILETFYDRDINKQYVNQDWMFWYYLSYLKCNWKEKNPKLDYPITEELFDDPISDLDKAKLYGYDDDKALFYKEPCTIIDEAPKVLADIMEMIDMSQLDEAYNNLFKELYIQQRLKNGKNEEIIGRFLLATLADCYYQDIDEVCNKKKCKTFSEKQIEIIKQKINNKPELFDGLENYIKNSPSELLSNMINLAPIKINECSMIDFEEIKNNSSFNYALTDNEIEEDESLVFSKLKFEWDVNINSRTNKAITENWTVGLTDKEIAGDRVQLYNIAKQTDFIKFYEQTKLERGKSYQIEFDVGDRDKHGFYTLGFSGALILLFLLF